MKDKEQGKTIDFTKAKEIPNFGMAGRTGRLKGDEYNILVTQDFKDGTVGILRYGKDGHLDALPRVPLICIVLDEVIATPFS